MEFYGELVERVRTEHPNEPTSTRLLFQHKLVNGEIDASTSIILNDDRPLDGVAGDTFKITIKKVKK